MSSVNPAQDRCELLQMTAVSAEEQVLTPRPVLRDCSLFLALTPATSSTASIKKCANSALTKICSKTSEVTARAVECCPLYLLSIQAF